MDGALIAHKRFIWVMAIGASNATSRIAPNVHSIVAIRGTIFANHVVVGAKNTTENGPRWTYLG